MASANNVDWANLPAEHNLSRFAAELPKILEETDHNEMYGVTLTPAEADKPTAHTTLIILQKFLRANAGDLAKAKEQLTKALRWRKEYKPMDALNDTFPSDKFGGLGYVTTIKGAKETKNAEDVAIFNIYGVAAKQPQKTFGDTNAFIRWRVALMELTLQQLHLDKADKTIPDYGQGPDPYQAIQIHDYLSVSFFRQAAEIKLASKQIITTFQAYYPETVSYKYFVNVPQVMQWMMGTMKMLISKDTFQKMTWLTHGNQLNQHLGENIPKEYGGNGAPIQEVGLTVKYDTQQKPADGARAADAAEENKAPESKQAEAAVPAQQAAEENKAPESTQAEAAVPAQQAVEETKAQQNKQAEAAVPAEEAAKEKVAPQEQAGSTSVEATPQVKVEDSDALAPNTDAAPVVRTT
ncbi:Phosphatidylinositol transfer protein SFH5 [Teratosphaeria destructans]|uniref:Phosphatidylinositol transfer protein SFH5 n=1 Tax=Teratosphaeria destructans TaxID=418781 RepID=A0A9W7STN0_9PEZI|nr:Phosphatidylinositol transfer protein SFH5 [Teratosphaeria destructans]